jgi:oligoribonuclease NrnB/cAMP/cGMP phosphodiesterase (DHH superfamily)
MVYTGGEAKRKGAQMNAIDHHADLNELIEKIKDLPGQCYVDAYQCAVTYDFAALAFIANMAEGLPGNFARRFGQLADLADLIQGISPRLVRGVKR